MVVLDAYLKKQGITQRQLADRLGCSQSLVSQWISGETKMTVDWALKIEKETERKVKRQQLLPDAYKGMAA